MLIVCINLFYSLLLFVLCMWYRKYKLNKLIITKNLRCLIKYKILINTRSTKIKKNKINTKINLIKIIIQMTEPQHFLIYKKILKLTRKIDKL